MSKRERVQNIEMNLRIHLTAKHTIHINRAVNGNRKLRLYRFFMQWNQIRKEIHDLRREKTILICRTILSSHHRTNERKIKTKTNKSAERERELHRRIRNRLKKWYIHAKMMCRAASHKVQCVITANLSLSLALSVYTHFNAARRFYFVRLFFARFSINLLLGLVRIGLNHCNVFFHQPEQT